MPRRSCPTFLAEWASYQTATPVLLSSGGKGTHSTRLSRCVPNQGTFAPVSVWRCYSCEHLGTRRLVTPCCELPSRSCTNSECVCINRHRQYTESFPAQPPVLRRMHLQVLSYVQPSPLGARTTVLLIPGVEHTCDMFLHLLHSLVRERACGCSFRLISAPFSTISVLLNSRHCCVAVSRVMICCMSRNSNTAVKCFGVWKCERTLFELVRAACSHSGATCDSNLPLHSRTRRRRSPA